MSLSGVTCLSWECRTPQDVILPYVRNLQSLKSFQLYVGMHAYSMIRVCALGIRDFFFCVINQKPDLRPMDGPLEKWLGWGGGEGRGVGVGKSRKYSWKKSWLKKRSCKDQVKTKYPGKWITLLGLQTVPAWMGTWKSLTTVVLISWSWWIAHSPGFLYSKKRKKNGHWMMHFFLGKFITTGT